jgi:hypothetical protein
LRFLFFSPARSRVYQAVTLAQLEPQYQQAGQLPGTGTASLAAPREFDMVAHQLRA